MGKGVTVGAVLSKKEGEALTEQQLAQVQRFQQIGGLLMSNPATMQYLLAEMRLQQMMADVYKILNDAAGLDMPGL